VRQLALRGVDAARDDVHDQVDALGVRQPVSAGLGREQAADQVVSRLGPAPFQQRLNVLVGFRRRPLDPRELAAQRADVELPLHPA
jgi:hypothetical protein